MHQRNKKQTQKTALHKSKKQKITTKGTQGIDNIFLEKT